MLAGNLDQLVVSDGNKSDRLETDVICKQNQDERAAEIYEQEQKQKDKKETN